MQRDSRFIRSFELAPDRPSDVWPWNIPAIRSLGILELHPAVTFIVGDNGSGKSTLLEALATRLGLNPEGGNRNIRFSSLQSESPLHESLRIDRAHRRISDAFFFRAETMSALFAAAQSEGWQNWTDRHTSSHGEGHLKLILDKLSSGFYIFDEPESALSVQWQMTFLRIIHDLVGLGSQLLIATHSPIILAYPNSRILELTSTGPQERLYEETQPYILTRRFLDRRKTMLAELFSDD